MVLQVVLIAATKAILVGRLQPGRQWKRNDLYHLRRSLMFIGQIPLGHTFVSALVAPFNIPMLVG